MADFASRLTSLLTRPLTFEGRYAVATRDTGFAQQQQTNEAFSDKWESYDKSPEKSGFFAMQKAWYLTLYGFVSEADLAAFLQRHPVIFDAGCGLGAKAAWFAELAPSSLVIGMDYSSAAAQAAAHYAHLPNLFFLRGDIADVPFTDGSVDYVSCDQVIMHTEFPDRTFAELTRITRAGGGEFACYFYAQKALPRELLDEHFRSRCKELSKDDLWAMSEQLAELGKRLSELNMRFECPDIPALGIKGGTYDVQRFLYWNFLKCYWNADLGRETSVMTNYDWYSPSNARRYSEQDVRALVAANGLSIGHFHSEEACYSGRFVKP